MIEAKVLVLVLSLNLFWSSYCIGDDCNNAIDVPLLDQLNAPLKAEIDISELNKQLKELISKEVKQSVAKAVNESVTNSVENRFKIAEDKLKADTNNTLTAMLRDMKNSKIDAVFFAYLSHNWKQLSKKTTLVYDVVDLNIGNGYDKSTGKFTAPSNGTYLFHVSTGAFDKTHAVVEVVVNGSVRNIAWADSYHHNDRTFATTVTPIRLLKGDTVFTRIRRGDGNYIESNADIRTSFSGIKIS